MAAYDIRGHGMADKPAGSEFYQPRRFADELDAVIRASGIHRPVIVGWSLGARMTFNYCEAYGAGAIGGFVIVGARAKQVPNDRDAGQSAIAQSCSDDLETRVRARLAFVRACYGKPLAPEDMAEIAACAMLVPPEVLRRFAGRPMDYEALLAGLPVPVRVLHGARDPVCTLDEVARIGQINRSADITLYPDLGHAPFFEDPAGFNADLLAFVRRCESAGQDGPDISKAGAVCG
jgi:pimeloyl-ACP methyl ester carboxylesterase